MFSPVLAFWRSVPAADDARLRRRSGFNRNLKQAGRPAALESAAAITGVVVDGAVQDIVAGFAELHVGSRFPAEGRVTGSTRQLRDFGFGFVAGYCAGPPVFRPGERHRRPS